ncbi:MAG: hypothetical protein B7C24_09620 [Bacteroidetes bacterium 4572_77]|nr:MAG: hypothetical protein B7C24_09620 [Bacteroidetes bacterium 4572_77]
MEHEIIGRKDILLAFKDSLEALEDQQGAFYLIEGDTGSGKTYLIDGLKKLLEEYNNKHFGQKKKVEQTYLVKVYGKQPIGNFNIGPMEPLNMVSLIVKELMNDDSITPEKRFMINVGMTLLACIPMVGEIPYAFKEISRDLEKLKSEQKTQNVDLRKGAFEEYMSYFKKYTSKKKLVILIDDIHWADVESIEFLWEIIKTITTIPVVIVATYKEYDLTSQGLPFLSIIDRLKKADLDMKFQDFVLTPFINEDINEFANVLPIRNYKENVEFEEWILEQSAGVPSVVAEYLDYFSKFKLFNDSGELITNFKDNKFLPASIQQLFGQKLDEMTDDERNLLSICSAEGKEFTAVVISRLLNTDVLDTIKRLRAIQNNTGLIKSNGAQYRYGLKTTIYQFTQAHYFTFFKNALEYEEDVALHSQVGAFLKEQYNIASEQLRQALAPLIAGHSVAAENSEQAAEMILESAKIAKEYDSSETIKQAFDNIENNNALFDGTIDFTKAMHNILKDIELSNNKTDGNTTDSQMEDSYLFDAIPDFKNLRRGIIQNLLEQNFSLTIAKIDKVLGDKKVDLEDIERAQLSTLKIKALIELREFDKAEILIEKIYHQAVEQKNTELQALVINNYALLFLAQGNTSAAIARLEEASALSTELLPEIQLLTLANIATALKKVAPIKAKKYFDNLSAKCKQAGYNKFEEDLRNIVYDE